METGMLWRDDDQKRTLEEKISRASQYYQNKYGKVPDICFVNRAMLEKEQMIEALLVRPVKNILPQHFWIGVKQTQIN